MAGCRRSYAPLDFVKTGDFVEKGSKTLFTRKKKNNEKLSETGRIGDLGAFAEGSDSSGEPSEKDRHQCPGGHTHDSSELVASTTDALRNAMLPTGTNRC